MISKMHFTHLCVERSEDIMYSISSQTGATESGLIGQHLAGTEQADVRLVCVLSVLFFYPKKCSLCGNLILFLFLCLVIWDSFNPTTLGSGPAVQRHALHLCPTTF